MNVRNETPFEYLAFESVDPQLSEFWVLVLRGTFRIVPNATLELAETQHPMVEGDVFRGEPNASSLLMECDIAPFKKRSDVMVNAIAHAPAGRPSPRWPVRLRVGSLDKTLHVTGPRRWIKNGRGYHLEAPEPCSSVPLDYEHAFGGVFQRASGQLEVFEQNPVGLGFVPAGEAPHEETLRAPQIESPDDPIVEMGRLHEPQGFGPITRSWEPSTTARNFSIARGS
jgi:hypothetical protein